MKEIHLSFKGIWMYEHYEFWPEMGYAVTYSSNPRKTFRIGCAFDCEKRSLGKWMVEATRS